MKNHALSLLALLLAAGALAVALVRTTSAAHVPAAAPPASLADAQALDTRIARVEDELALLRGALDTSRLSAPSERETAAPDTATEAAVDARLVEVERRLDELRTAKPIASTDAIETARVPGTRKPDSAEAVEQWTRVAHDVALTAEERVGALRRLRGVRLADGTDARLGVLPEMIRLAEQSPDARIRADVWRQLSRVKDRSLLAPLLHALQHDASAEVREEAAETLGHFMPDPEVQSALRFAGENDASPKVRAQAYESLDE